MQPKPATEMTGRTCYMSFQVNFRHESAFFSLLFDYNFYKTLYSFNYMYFKYSNYFGLNISDLYMS